MYCVFEKYKDVCVCFLTQVYEAVPCHSDCSQYEWRVESWSICTINAVDELPACGEGVQSRKIRSECQPALADHLAGAAAHIGWNKSALESARQSDRFRFVFHFVYWLKSYQRIHLMEASNSFRTKSNTVTWSHANTLAATARLRGEDLNHLMNSCDKVLQVAKQKWSRRNAGWTYASAGSALI